MNLLQKYKAVAFIISMMIASAFSVYITFKYFVQFSGFAVVLAMVSTVIVLVIAVDKTVLDGINTLEEIKNGNTAVAITYLAIAVLFLGCLMFV